MTGSIDPCELLTDFRLRCLSLCEEHRNYSNEQSRKYRKSSFWDHSHFLAEDGIPLQLSCSCFLSHFCKLALPTEPKTCEPESTPSKKPLCYFTAKACVMDFWCLFYEMGIFIFNFFGGGWPVAFLLCRDYAPSAAVCFELLVCSNYQI